MNNPNSNTITPQSIVVVSPEQVSSELVGESVILNLKTGMYFGLNEVGASVWQLLQTPKSVADICTEIQQEYDVQPAQCEQDIMQLLNELINAQLIQVQNAAVT